VMKDVKNPEKLIPAHEREVAPKSMQEGPSGGVMALPYHDKFGSQLTRQRLNALALPDDDLAKLNNRWQMEQSMQRGQAGLMRDLGLK
jgi:hypothetical protein